MTLACFEKDNRQNRLASQPLFGALLVLLFIGGSCVSASAATDTATLSVSVTVQDTCSISGGSMDFGTYMSGQADTVPTIGAISYSGCAVGTTVNIELDGGQANSEIPRSMTDGNGNLLEYYIFQDAARTIYWGSGFLSKDVIVDNSGSGIWEVYGRIIREQTVPSGSYADSVNITLTF